MGSIKNHKKRQEVKHVQGVDHYLTSISKYYMQTLLKNRAVHWGNNMESHNFDFLEKKALELGATSYLVKANYKLEDVVTKIKDFLEK